MKTKGKFGIFTKLATVAAAVFGFKPELTVREIKMVDDSYPNLPMDDSQITSTRRHKVKPIIKTDTRPMAQRSRRAHRYGSLWHRGQQ